LMDTGSAVSEDAYLRIKKTTPYYNAIRSLAFPSRNRILVSLFAVDVLGTALAFLIVDPTEGGLLQGVSAGFLVFLVPTVVSDFLSAYVTIPRDPLFFMRRILALSLFGNSVWIIIMLIGAAVSKMFESFLYPLHAFYLGLFVVLPLRSLTIFSMSTTSLPRRALFSVSDPVACSVGLAAIIGSSVTRLVTSLALAVVVSFVFSLTFLVYVERQGIKTLGVRPLRIFRAFLRDWLDGSFSTFENYLEIFGVDSTINVCVLSFRSKFSGNLKGTLVVSNFHPGPFLNVGSSALPYMIKRVVEKMAGGVAAVAHGVSGHQLNLVSQHENQKVIERILSMLAAPKHWSDASPLVRSTAGSATATCQVFGNSAVVTMTVAPEDNEDIDLEVGELLRKSARGFLNNVAIIDAHNSLGKVTLMSREKLNDLAESAKLAMKATRGIGLQSPLMGVAELRPHGISLREGMGPGGIVLFWVKVGEQSSAYVVFDSNNMATGLRERILSALRDAGAADAEVMTSDTHMVNGITSAKLGYYPIGASTDPEMIVESVKRASEEAKRNIEPVDTSLSCSELQVRTLGLSSLSQLTGFVLRTARLTFLTFFPVMLVIAAISFIFLI
jgi:putative membrane protein